MYIVQRYRQFPPDCSERQKTLLKRRAVDNFEPVWRSGQTISLGSHHELAQWLEDRSRILDETSHDCRICTTDFGEYALWEAFFDQQEVEEEEEDVKIVWNFLKARVSSCWERQRQNS